MTSPLKGKTIEIQPSGLLAKDNHHQSDVQEREAREVTHFTSLRPLDPSAFSQSSSVDVARNILTTETGAGEYSLFSINVPRMVRPPGLEGDNTSKYERLYRIVSQKTLPDREIARFFGYSLALGESLRDIGVTWIDRKRWESGFKPFRANDFIGDSQVADGLYITAQGEGIVGSMEMSCRMSRQVGDRLFEDLLGPVDTYP